MSNPRHPPAQVEFSVCVTTPPMEIWRMWVEPDLMPLWLGDFRLVCTWQVGSELEVQGHLQGHPYTEKGTLLALEPQKLLRYTHWSPLWGLPDLPGHHAVVTLRLVPGTEGTHLHFHHELPPVEALAEHSRFFWRVSLEQLKRVVEGQTTPGVDLT